MPSYRFLVEHSQVAQLVRQAVIAWAPTGEVPTIEQGHAPEAVALTKGLFARLSAWCKSRGIALLVTNGSLLEFSEDRESVDATAMFLTDADRFFTRLGVPYLSVARAHGPLTVPLQSLEIEDDGHPNERGAGLIYEAVWPWLRDQLRPIVERPRS